MDEDFMVTEVVITRGRRTRHEDGSWEWINPERNLVKRGIVLQQDDTMTKSFLANLHASIADIMGKLFEDWKLRKELQPKAKPILTAVRDGIANRGES